MPWWNPFSTEANNGKTAAELEAERAALDARTRARLEGAQLDEWNRQVEDTRAREAATDSETVGDAFEQGLDEGADNIRGAVSGTFNVVGKGLAGVLTGIPFWVWALVILAALQYFGLLRPLVGKLFKGKKA